MPRKPNSTNQLNERGLILGCPMTYTSSLLGRRWKPILLWKIHEGLATSAELKRAVPLVSRKMLFESLRELAETGLVAKHGHGTQPPTYRLTPRGASLLPVLAAMLAWGEQHRPTPLLGTAQNGS